jgi:hypothetical protein
VIPFGITALNRFEHIADISYTANTPTNLPTQGGQLVDTRWCWGLLLTLEGRATMPGASMPTAQEADGIAQLIERVTMEGFHRVRQRNERFFDLRGADVDFLTKRWTLGAFPSAPTTWAYTASATNDFREHLLVPFVPMGITSKEQQAYLLDVPNYDTLKLTVQWGDSLSVFGTGTAPTLTAYGSATGSPKVRVAGLWALAGASRFVNRVPGRTFRYFQELTGSLLTTTATGVRMIDIPRGNVMRSITVKTGVKSTTISSGNNAYVTLSDTILANIKINRGINRPVRYYPLMHQIQCENVLQSMYSKSGYGVIDFARNGALAESFDARPLVSGPSGQVDFFAEADVTGTTDQAATFIWEEIQALPIATTVR